MLRKQRKLWKIGWQILKVLLLAIGLDHQEAGQRDLRTELRDLRNRAVDKWEVRIWFIILLLVISLYRFLG